MQSFTEFKKEIVPSRKNKLGKVRKSFGIYDVYKYMRKKGWYNIGRPLKEHEFYCVIRQINDLLAKELSLGNTVTFPSGMGKLELRKSRRGVSIINGKMVVSYPVDWVSTLHLWHKDPDAYSNKTLLRYNQNYTYKIKYNNRHYNFKNKSFYLFKLNSFIKKALSQNINKGIIETHLET